MSRLTTAFRGLPPASGAYITALAFLLATALVMAFALERERRQLLEQARHDAGTLAALFDESTARTFDAVDVTLEGLATYFSVRDRVPKHDPVARDTMRARLAYMPTVRALFVIGPDGRIVHDTDYPKTPDISLADRPYFREYLQDPALRRSMSAAMQSRSGTGWFVAASRRITGPDGSFRGIVVAAVQLDSISRLYKRLDLTAGHQVWLLRDKGELIASYPQDDALVGRNFAQFPVFSNHLPRDRAGVFDVDEGPPLGFPRVVAYRAVQNHPFVVVLTSDKREVLAPWWRAAFGALAALAALALLTAGVLLYFVRHQRERRRAEEHANAEESAKAIAALNAKFRTFFEQGALFSCVLSTAGDVLDVNRAVKESGGLGPGELDGRKFWDATWWAQSPTQAAVLRQGFAQAVGGSIFRCEPAFSTATGEQRLVELVLSPVRDESGALLCVAAVGVDITARKLQEESLRRMAAELSDADRLRNQFLATLSHELRNVLAPVQNCVQLLNLVDPTSEQGKRARGILGKQVAQMRSLIDDLLDIARVNSGKIHIARQRVDLTELLSQAAYNARTFMEQGSHRFDVELPAEPAYVEGDSGRLLQVFANLLGNAAKYTPQRGHVRLRARREGHEAVVEVIDNGLGIPLDAQARIFDMFEQVRDHAENSEGGLGIGLALVQKLVALHGGHVEAYSEGPGCGSTFTVYLPLIGAPARGGTPAVSKDIRG